MKKLSTYNYYLPNYLRLVAEVEAYNYWNSWKAEDKQEVCGKEHTNNFPSAPETVHCGQRFYHPTAHVSWKKSGAIEYVWFDQPLEKESTHLSLLEELENV